MKTETIVVLLTICLAVTRGFSQSANDGFDPNVNGRVQAIALQADGKIIVGGEFTAVGGITRSNIARLNVDGTLDATFNPGTDIDCVGCYQSVSALAVQSDGKILVGGRLTVLSGTAWTNIGRLNTNGSVDTSFQSSADGQVLELAVVAGGKVIVAGAFFTLNGQSCVGIGRLNADGSLDTNFNAGANDTVNSLAVQPDGRILVGGDFTMLGGQTRVGIGRLNADGSLDASFNPGAITEEMETLALQADGKVLVGGDFTMIGDVPRAGIGRLNADGSLDSSFNPGMEGDGLHTLVVQPDGKILVGGFFTTLGGQSCTNFGRLNPDGTLDSSFHPEVDSAVNRFVVQPDSKILVGGWFTTLGGTNRNHLGRLYPDGKLDVTLNTEVIGPAVVSLCIQPEGKILVAGPFSTLGGLTRSSLGRLNSDGSVDNLFTNGGNDPVRCMIAQADGKVVLAGQFTMLAGNPCNWIGRLNADGSFDTTFVRAVTNVNALSLGILGLALQPDGKILVGGFFDATSGLGYNNLARLNADGSIDSSFSAEADNTVQGLAVQPDGKILVGGLFTTLYGRPRSRIGRLHVDGSVDETFNPGADGTVYCLSVQADKMILVCGSFSTLGGQPHLSIGRLNPDGTADTAFNPEAGLTNSPSRATVRALALQTDGRILITGSFTRLNDQPRAFIGRLNPDGSLDPTFNPGVSGPPSSPAIYALAVQTDGKILAGGQFPTLGGLPRLRLGRLSSGGAASQILSINRDGSTATWSRGGAGPEVEQVTFELSADGTNYSALGSAARISDGWRLRGLAMPRGEKIYLRARGRTTSGLHNGTIGLIESIAQFYLIPPAHITSVGKLGSGEFQFAFTNTTGASYTVLATTNVASPTATWEVLGAPVPVGNGLYQFTDLGGTNHARRFYQLRSP